MAAITLSNGEELEATDTYEAMGNEAIPADTETDVRILGVMFKDGGVSNGGFTSYDHWQVQCEVISGAYKTKMMIFKLHLYDPDTRKRDKALGFLGTLDKLSGSKILKHRKQWYEIDMLDINDFFANTEFTAKWGNTNNDDYKQGINFGKGIAPIKAKPAGTMPPAPPRKAQQAVQPPAHDVNADYDEDLIPF